MPLPLIIADDLTGAAEIAAIAHQAGFATQLHWQTPTQLDPGKIHVVDTETRLLSPAAAAAHILQILTRMRLQRGCPQLFKKTDSAMRGPIVAELTAICQHLDYHGSLLVCANPAAGRTIQGGIYRINGVPLHQTAFAHDPTHPARSANVLELLGIDNANTPYPIHVANACNAGHLQFCADTLDPHLLPAGSSAFFASWLQRHFPTPPQAPVTSADTSAVTSADTSAVTSADTFLLPQRPDNFGTAPVPRALLVVSGTAIAERRRILADMGIASLTLAELADPAAACRNLRARLSEHGKAGLYLAADEPPPSAPASYVSEALAQIAAALATPLASPLLPLHIVIEGGATAAAVVQRLGIQQLSVLQVWADGVVTLNADGAHQLWITLKPGSYPWPASFCRSLGLSCITT